MGTSFHLFSLTWFNHEGGITWTRSKELKDLDYAEDFCLLAENYEEMQHLSDQLSDDAAKIELEKIAVVSR